MQSTLHNGGVAFTELRLREARYTASYRNPLVLLDPAGRFAMARRFREVLGSMKFNVLPVVNTVVCSQVCSESLLPGKGKRRPCLRQLRR